LVKNTKLKFKTPIINPSTGKPILNLTPELSEKLGIKTVTDVESFRDQIPNVTFADIIDQLLDSVPFSSNKHFATYNNVLIDIRNAKLKELDYIEIEKQELETLKAIFEKAIINKPEINRNSAFIIEVLDQCIADIISENNPENTIVESPQEN